MNIEHLITISFGGSLSLNEIDKFRSKQDRSRESVFNELAIGIAKQFQSLETSYEDCDEAINNVWGSMIEDSVEQGDGFELAQPAYAIYEAFDAGEFDHKDGDDPIEKYTKPEISEILKNA
jgi:hypothetical protein